MNKKIILASLVGILLAVGVTISLQPANKSTLGSGGIDQFGDTTVTTFIYGSATTTQVLAANAVRRYLLIQNNGSSSILCLPEGSKTAASSSVVSSTAGGGPIGILITGTSTASLHDRLELKGYVGVVNCLGVGAGTSTMTVITSP